MEQKKTLWIIAAVGTFLLVVLGTAGILYSPSKNPSPTVTAVASQNTDKTDKGWTDTSMQEQSPVPLPSQSDTPSSQQVNEMVVLSGNTTVYDVNKNKTQEETTIDLNDLKAGMIGQNPDININVTVPDYRNDSARPVEIPVKTEKAEISSVNKKSETTADKKEAAPIKRKETPVSSKKTNPAVPAAIPEKKADNKPVTQYWVQVASYSNKRGAENARDILASNRLNPDIFTYKDEKNDLYYRVRIGPYTTKSEAEYWKAKVLKISDFKGSDSYITSTVK